MGMTIDEAITWLNTDDYESKGFADATSVAIETMRKYQKIEDIYYHQRGEALENSLRAVIEDGKS
jgi:hypothetical protein